MKFFLVLYAIIANLTFHQLKLVLIAPVVLNNSIIFWQLSYTIGC